MALADSGTPGVVGAPVTTDAENETKARDASVRRTTAGQVTRPVGDSMDVSNRALDVALSPDESTLFVKTKSGLLLVDAKGPWGKKPRQFLKFETEAGSWHGLAVSRDGRHIFLSGNKRTIDVAKIDDQGMASWSAPLTVATKGNSQPTGLVLSPDGSRLYVCLGISNTLGVVDLATQKLVREIPVGVCPYDVGVSPDGASVYVSNFGGRRTKPGELSETSAGTEVLVDSRSIASSGTVSVIDARTLRETGQIEVGTHPAGMALSRNGRRLYVANANDDSVSVVDTSLRRVNRRIPVRPDPLLPFGSIANAVTLSPDEKWLFVANAGNNAVAVCDLATTAAAPAPAGFIPTGWFPGGVVCGAGSLYVANVKGGPDGYSGSIQRVGLPDPATLARDTAQAIADAHVPQALQALAVRHTGAPPVPVPVHTGESSLIQHVVYIIKENKTYDQLLGDLPRGNHDPKLCVFGHDVTPNTHALAEQFTLLDNYYCNGVVSSDGHAWAVQGIVTDYREKDITSSSRSYDFGTDPLCYANCNFLWDSVLLHGLSFRDYGEFSFPTLPGNPKRTWFDVYGDYQKTGAVKFNPETGVHTLEPYLCREFPGWNLEIPDQFRADVFLRELADFEKQGTWPSLIVLYLPQDHTNGKSERVPTQRAFVADNDLAMGRCIEGISKSKFWPQTCIFVTEDDPQTGADHVDGHRSICLLASPFARRGAVVNKFYSQASVLHTICRILGVPPLNQIVAQATTMEDCFTATADLTPYVCQANIIPLDERNPPPAAASPALKKYYAQTASMNFTKPDLIDENLLNRMQWAEAHPGLRYPAEFAGPHGRGLKALGLKLLPNAKDND
jgi:YVTN family beta-propeller protein